MKQQHCAGGPLIADADYELLKAPILLRKGDVLRQRKLKIAPDFAWDTRLAAIYGDAADITIEDVELVGDLKWQDRWFTLSPQGGTVGQPPGIPTELVGIRLQGCPGLRMERVKVHGIPRAGVEAIGIDYALLSGLDFERCLQGLNVRAYKPNRRIRIEHVKARDLWGPPFGGSWPGIGGPPSARPGEFMGSDGLVLGRMLDSSIHDVEVIGEQLLGIKMGGYSSNVTISHFRGSGFMVQGTDGRVDSECSEDITLRDSVIDKSFGAGAHVDGGNAVQVSFNVQGFRLLDSQIRGVEGKNGSAIELVGNVHGEVRGCSIRGFNGFRGTVGGKPSQCGAVSVGDGSSVNADFETANRFTDQQRLVVNW